MKKRVLITSVGRKVSLVKAFKDAGWEVCGQDSDPTAIALKFCDGVPRGEYDLVVPTRDAELLNYSDCPYSTPEESIKICLDKLLFYHFCKTHGFATPQVIFSKPRISKSGKEVECLHQEYIDAPEYSIDLFADFGGNVIGAVPRQRVKTSSGESTHTVTVANKRLLEESVSLARCLGLRGHNVLQCFMVNDSPIWLEVNCRFGGASVVAIAAGLKSPAWLLDLVGGKKVEPRIGDYGVGLIGRSYSTWEFNE